MDPQRRVIENGAVAMSGDHIVEVGSARRSTRKYQRGATARPAGRDPGARADQHPHARGDVSVSRRRRRYEAAGLARRSTFSRPKPRTSTANSCAGGRGWLCSKWLFREPPPTPTCIISRTRWPRRPRRRACAACWARRSSASLRRIIKTPQAALAGTEKLFKELCERPADRAGGRAARHLHQVGRDAASRPARWRTDIRSHW